MYINFKKFFWSRLALLSNCVETSKEGLLGWLVFKEESRLT